MVAIGNDTFTRLRASFINSGRGEWYYDWENPEELVVTGAKINPYKLAEKLSYEITDQRDYARSGLKIYCPVVDILHSDRIVIPRYPNVVFTVFGHPFIWTDFEGNDDHMELTIQVREG